MVYWKKCILYSNESEWSVLLNDMKKFHKRRKGWKKPDINKHMLHNFTYISFNNISKLLVVIEMRKADFFCKRQWPGKNLERCFWGFFVVVYVLIRSADFTSALTARNYLPVLSLFVLFSSTISHALLVLYHLSVSLHR